MIFREATISDIPQIQIVRHAVKENVLSSPSLVTDEDCKEYLAVRGKGWVCEVESGIIGFAIVDLLDHNVWALFLNPEYEGRGVGRQLHNMMLDWYFGQTQHTIWLSTAVNTRAQTFYQLQGWQETGMYNSQEVRFEMTFDSWKSGNRQ